MKNVIAFEHVWFKFLKVACQFWSKLSLFLSTFSTYHIKNFDNELGKLLLFKLTTIKIEATSYTLIIWHERKLILNCIAPFYFSSFQNQISEFLMSWLFIGFDVFSFPHHPMTLISLKHLPIIVAGISFLAKKISTSVLQPSLLSVWHTSGVSHIHCVHSSRCLIRLLLQL